MLSAGTVVNKSVMIGFLQVCVSALCAVSYAAYVVACRVCQLPGLCHIDDGILQEFDWVSKLLCLC